MDALTTTATVASPSEQAGLIDIRQITNTIRRRIVPIAVATVIVLALTIFTFIKTERQYAASARVAVDRRVDEFVPGTGQPPALVTDSSSVDTEVQVLTSPRIVGDVVDKLGLAKSDAIIPVSRLGNVSAETKRALVTEVLRSKLQVAREGLSYAININYMDKDPVLTAAVVNAVAEAYVGGQKDDRSAQTDQEVKLLRERIEKLRGQVQSAEAQVASYRASTTLLDIDKDGVIGQQAIANLNSSYSQARAEQAAAEARYNAASRGDMSSLDGGSTQGVRQLRAEAANLSSQRAAMAQQYGPNYPPLQQIDSQLAEANRQLALETSRINAGLAAEAKAARDRAASIAGSIGQQRGELASANSSSVKLGDLQREADAARTLYQGLLERYRQATASQGTERANSYIISKAMVPMLPASPNLIVFLLAGVLAAGVAATAVTVVLEMLDNGLSTRASVEQTLGIPVLSSIPDLRSVQGGKEASKSPLTIGQYLVEHRGSVFSESFRNIRTALKIGQKDQLARSVAVTSALPDEGKTTVALSLARSAALAGLKVVLIDCDVRRRASTRNIRQDVDIGLIEVLKGAAAPEQALVLDRRSGVSVLPQSAAGEQDYDMMATQAMRDLVKRLSGFFDLVVLDTAPVLAIADARAVSAMADRAVLVVRWRKTPANAAQLALGQLERAGAAVAGVIMSRVDLRQQSRTGQGDEMYYFQQYKKYYTS